MVKHVPSPSGPRVRYWVNELPAIPPQDAVVARFALKAEAEYALWLRTAAVEVSAPDADGPYALLGADFAPSPDGFRVEIAAAVTPGAPFDDASEAGASGSVLGGLLPEFTPGAAQGMLEYLHGVQHLPRLRVSCHTAAHHTPGSSHDAFVAAGRLLMELIVTGDIQSSPDPTRPPETATQDQSPKP